MNDRPDFVFAYPTLWRIKVLFPLYTIAPLFTFCVIFVRDHGGIFLWFLMIGSYLFSFISVLTVSNVKIRPNKIERSFFGINLVTIYITSVSEIRKTIIYDRVNIKYIGEISIRQRKSPKKDGISGLLNTIIVRPEIIGFQELKECLLDISVSNNIALTLVDSRAPPIGRGPEAFVSPIRVSEL